MGRVDGLYPTYGRVLLEELTELDQPCLLVESVPVEVLRGWKLLPCLLPVTLKIRGSRSY